MEKTAITIYRISLFLAIFLSVILVLVAYIFISINFDIIKSIIISGIIILILALPITGLYYTTKYSKGFVLKIGFIGGIVLLLIYFILSIMAIDMIIEFNSGVQLLY